MDCIPLGKTGLNVTVMGLGGGGPSRLGHNTGKDHANAVRVVRGALDAGINFIDTAEAYGTEDAVGEAVAEHGRAKVVISTKVSTWQETSPDSIRASLAETLRKLRTDYVDIYHLHGVPPDRYAELAEMAVPVLQDMQRKGAIRFIGITEVFGRDTRHAMLQRALQDDVWQVIMVGFNLLNQTARATVFPVTQAKGIGTLIMFAVRRALSNPARLREVLDELVASGEIDADVVRGEDPLGFLVREYGAASVTDAAYRFCRYEPGAEVILSGTGDIAHLRENIASLDRPPLPDAAVQRLKTIFARVTSASGS